MVVYLITNLVNQRKYIGITTKSLKRRWAVHKSCAARGSNVAIHRALRKYGHENFSISVIGETDSESELLSMEIKFILEYKSRSPLGYNMTDGGTGRRGLTQTTETRKKLSHAFLGKPLLQSTRDKIRIAHLGKKLSEDHKRKLSMAKLGKKLTRTPEHNAKISEAKKKANQIKRDASLL